VPARRPDLRLHLRFSRSLSGLHGTYEPRQGDSLDVALSWGVRIATIVFDAGAMLEATTAAWHRWMTRVSYDGPAAARRRASGGRPVRRTAARGSQGPRPMPRQPPARHRAERSRPQAPGRCLVTARHGPPGADGSGRHAPAVYRLRADDLATAVKRDGQGSNS